MAFLAALSIWQVLALAALYYATWSVASGLYNIFFHPLRKYPGPKAAAFTTWWKTNIEVFQGRNFTETLVDLHARYGDIVRIGPNELHFAKPSVFHEIHCAKNRWDKDSALYHTFTTHENMLTMPDYRRAKQRRDMVQMLFSRKSILNLQHTVQDTADKMCANMKAQLKAGKPINYYRAYRCFAMDGITSFCFGASVNATEMTDFLCPAIEAMAAAMDVVPSFKHFAWFKRLIRGLPVAITGLLNPPMKGMGELLKILEQQIDEVLAHQEVLQSSVNPTIFREFLSGEKGPVLTKIDLQEEAFLLVFAGTDTSSNTLALGTTHILQNPHVYKRLTEELVQAWPNLEERPSYETLETLPYLKAVLKESLRLSFGVMTPIPRVVPTGGAQIDNQSIPGGTIVSIGIPFVHLNPDIFPDPHAFKPERWLEGHSKDDEPLDRWLLTFSRGPRSCVGMNLGWLELTLAAANVFRKFELELDGLSVSDMKWKECYVPHYHGPDMKVRARVRLS